MAGEVKSEDVSQAAKIVCAQRGEDSVEPRLVAGSKGQVKYAASPGDKILL